LEQQFILDICGQCIHRLLTPNVIVRLHIVFSSLANSGTTQAINARHAAQSHCILSLIGQHAYKYHHTYKHHRLIPTSRGLALTLEP